MTIIHSVVQPKKFCPGSQIPFLSLHISGISLPKHLNPSSPSSLLLPYSWLHFFRNFLTGPLTPCSFKAYSINNSQSDVKKYPYHICPFLEPLMLSHLKCKPLLLACNAQHDCFLSVHPPPLLLCCLFFIYTGFLFVT